MFDPSGFHSQQLPTTPIGKQQVIDMKAGAILKHERKNFRFLGINAHVLLLILIIVKGALFGAWLGREFSVFERSCPGLLSFYEEYRWRRSIEVTRPKRSTDEQSRMMESNMVRPHVGGPRAPLTTMVTMTNLQELPVANSMTPIRMKTIRQRVEQVRRTNEMDEEEDYDDDDMLEITLEGPPKIYIAPIQSRKAEQGETPLPPTPIPATKPPRRKGKGRKKNKSTTPEPTTPKPEKKRRKKGHGRKKNREKQTDQTKSPRHLFSGVPARESKPTSASFLHGPVEAHSNKGEIRTYQLHPATKKPKPPLKVSKETQLMWEMDELNYTTHLMAPMTTQMTKEKELDPPEKKLKNRPPSIPFAEVVETTTEKRIDLDKEELTTWPKNDKPEVTTHRPKPEPSILPVIASSTRKPRVRTTQPVAIYYEETVIGPPQIRATTEELDKQFEPQMELKPSPKPRPVKHGFDRNPISYTRTTTPPTTTTDQASKTYFPDQLRYFTSQAICIARALLNVWCAVQIISAFPFLIGICVGLRSWFVMHMVADFLFILTGFLTGITMVVLSTVLFCLIEEMTTSMLLNCYIFAGLLVLIVFVYSTAFFVSLKCCALIVLSRKSRQAICNNNNSTYSTCVEL